MTTTTKTEVTETIKERHNTHGYFPDQCAATQRFKKHFREMRNWDNMPSYMHESLEMIAVKLGRIAEGDYTFDDSWHDIAGYATLVEKQLNEDLYKVTEKF